MVDVRGDILRPPHGTTPAAVKSNIKSEMRSFKSNENIHKKEGETMEDEDRVVTATDIKTAVKASCEKKWQRRWNLTNSGRGLFEHRKEVRSKKISNDQELIQSDPISCPQNQKGNN